MSASKSFNPAMVLESMPSGQEGNFASATADLSVGLAAAAWQDAVHLLWIMQNAAQEVWEEIVISVSWWTYRITER